jgi:hypothetical protein
MRELSSSKHLPYFLVRVLGNDLPPRHAPGQTRRNLEFILRHEGCWPELAKSWIVNRIWDREEEARIVDLLESHGQIYQRLTFNLTEYARQPFAYEQQTTPFSREYRGMIRPRRARADLHARRHRANYAINNNGGRMAALRRGRGTSTWVLPWDGNCFLTQEGWTLIKQTVEANSHLPYFVVPMARVAENRLLLDEAFCPSATEEPQLIFRHDSPEEFDPTRPYGRRPKVDLLWRLRVPGPWDKFEDDPWDPPRPALSPYAGQFAWASWVARLESGHANLEKATRWSGWRRGQTRTSSITAALDRLDAEAVSTLLLEGPLLLDEARLADAAKAWSAGCGLLHEAAVSVMAIAEQSVARKPQSSQQHTILRTLAWQISGREAHAQAAAATARLCLVRATPHRASAGEFGLFLDALKLLEAGGFLHQEYLSVFQRRLHRLLVTWTRGWWGARRTRQTGLEALNHDLRSAVVAAYLRRHEDLAEIVRRFHARFAWRFSASQPMAAPDAAEGRAWLTAALIAERAGMGFSRDEGVSWPERAATGATDSSEPCQDFWLFTSLPAFTRAAGPSTVGRCP